jgi:ribosomal protein L11 methyltransferase
VSRSSRAYPVAQAVRVSVPAAEAELAADALWQAGAVAIEERLVASGVLLVAGSGAHADPAPLLEAVAGRWPAEPVSFDLDAALDAWREHARPVVVGDRLVVRPPWVDAQAGVGTGVVDVVIDPERAFGSGAHPSTRLLLAVLDQLVAGGERVLDVGCGSGVLAIAALALGAAEAVGVDVDRAAVAATRANAERNGVAGRLSVADVLDEIGGTYDLVLANMLQSQLVAAAPVVAGVLAPGGTLALSGMLAGQRDEVLAAYRRAGLESIAADDDDGWLALVLRASSG